MLKYLLIGMAISVIPTILVLAAIMVGGRTRDDLAVYPQVLVGMGHTSEELDAAAWGVRGLLGFYGSTPAYLPVLEVEGWADVQPELNALSKRGGFAAMTELITTDMMTTLAVHGTPEECAAQILDRFGDHADRVCCYFPGYPVADAQIAELSSALQAAT